MGYDEVKIRNQSVVILDLPRSVAAATASFRDDFRHILGSEPIVEEIDKQTFRIATYGGGEYQIVGQFSITQLPGCCGIVVFYHASVTNKFTGRGLGRLFLHIREKAAILAGYTQAMATVLKSNDIEGNLLESEGWAETDTFKNNRTGNMVRVLFKTLG